MKDNTKTFYINKKIEFTIVKRKIYHLSIDRFLIMDLKRILKKYKSKLLVITGDFFSFRFTNF
jgi:hypothetical protein